MFIKSKGEYFKSSLLIYITIIISFFLKKSLSEEENKKVYLLSFTFVLFLK